MRCNVGGTDRAIRAALGVVFALIAIFVPMDTVWRVLLLVLAGIAFFTVVSRYCPLNSLFGINTCRSPQA